MPQDAGPIVQLNHAPIQQAKYRTMSGGSVASCCAFTCPRPNCVLLLALFHRTDWCYLYFHLVGRKVQLRYFFGIK